MIYSQVVQVQHPKVIRGTGIALLEREMYDDDFQRTNRTPSAEGLECSALWKTKFSCENGMIKAEIMPAMRPIA